MEDTRRAKDVLWAKAVRLIFAVGSLCINRLIRAQQRLFDRLLGVSTNEVVYTDGSILVAGGDNVHYEGCQWLPVRRALKDLSPNAADVFVDLGSGKGKALLIAGRLPYRQVVGVELSKDLSRYSQRNVERARPRLHAQQIETITANVLEWPVPDDVTVIFMYNPFIGETFRKAAGRIFDSYDRRPRDLHIVYDDPWEHDWLLSTGRVVVDNVRPNSRPARLRWWQDGSVIVSYRVVSVGETSHSSPRLPRYLIRRRLAMRRWSRPNGQRFVVTGRGQEAVYSRP